MRLDAFLVENGYVSGREKAKELIESGAVTVNGIAVTKAAKHVTEQDTVVCDTSSIRYVGRGGMKLEKALQISGFDPGGCTAMDVGASTGGFTDCLLQAGAEKVYAVDVGTDQLHPSLRDNHKVVVLEGTDIRSEALKDVIPAHSIDVCAIDVSFISLQRVLPAITTYLRENATVLCLVKPQFEAGRAAVGKKGVVRDKKVHCAVLEEFCRFCGDQKFRVETLDFSPITGGEGNIEFLIILVYTNTETGGTTVVPIKETVEKAHRTLG